MSVDLDELQELRELDRAALAARLGAGPEHFEAGVRYERLRPVDCLHVPGAHPAHFYFDGSRLAMIYLGAGALAGVDPAILEPALGEPEAVLASRAGYNSTIRVFATKGVAFSSDDADVEFLEVFPPTTLDRYVAEVYEDPGEFIR